jgi:hypothetical protein
VEVLLAFLPAAADAGVEDDVIGVLRLGLSAGKAHPALVRALTDQIPLRRAAAGEVLARAGLAEHGAAVRLLVQDPTVNASEHALFLHRPVNPTGYARIRRRRSSRRLALPGSFVRSRQANKESLNHIHGPNAEHLSSLGVGDREGL